MTNLKKYTNADFYKNGVFQQEIAIEAMKEMFVHYNIPFTGFMAENMWVTDFGLGDFENVGMGGIFWVNDPKYGYFAHAIYLLPGQMIPEHAHVKTDFPAKHESWMVEKGWVYNFSEVGETTPNAPVIPATHGPVKSKNCVIQKVGDILRLKEMETFHFMMAGPEGAVVCDGQTITIMPDCVSLTLLLRYEKLVPHINIVFSIFFFADFYSRSSTEEY